MARPRKTGLDYFPLDTDMLSDRKLQAPRRKFGYLAIVVYLQLLCMLYRDKGYYIEFDAEQRQEVATAILAEVLIGQYQPKLDTILEVVEALVQSRLFDLNCYHKGILTSKRAQMVYYSATIERRAVRVDPAIWRLTQQEMRELSGKHSLVQGEKAAPETPKDAAETAENPTQNTQRKVEHSTENQSTAQQCVWSADDKTRSRQKFQDLFGRAPKADFWAAVGALGQSAWAVQQGMEIAQRKNVDKPEPYILAILRNQKPDATLAAPQEPADWEREWLLQKQERKARREREAADGTAGAQMAGEWQGTGA